MPEKVRVIYVADSCEEEGERSLDFVEYIDRQFKAIKKSGDSRSPLCSALQSLQIVGDVMEYGRMKIVDADGNEVEFIGVEVPEETRQQRCDPELLSGDPRHSNEVMQVFGLDEWVLEGAPAIFINAISDPVLMADFDSAIDKYHVFFSSHPHSVITDIEYEASDQRQYSFLFQKIAVEYCLLRSDAYAGYLRVAAEMLHIQGEKAKNRAYNIMGLLLGLAAELMTAKVKEDTIYGGVLDES